MSKASTAQDAGILASQNSADTMGMHEKFLLTGQEGIFSSAPIPDEMRTAIERNKKLWMSFGVRSVPFAMGKNMVTGKLEVLDCYPTPRPWQVNWVGS